MKEPIKVIKTSGEKVKFSLTKLRTSLYRSGASRKVVDSIINNIRDRLYQGISTKEIYDRAFALLKNEQSHFASKYKLKKAIYELGPTGFPFERLVAEVFKYQGYTTVIGKIIQGRCVSHEVDVVATKDGVTTIIECKFHSEEEYNCNIKVPLYIQSRYQDIKSYWNIKKEKSKLDKGWVVTNTRFTKDALNYGECIGLYLLSWDFPKGESLKDHIDALGLYPVTVSTLLTESEKQFLLNKSVVLCKQLLDNVFYLDSLGISEDRKKRILKDFEKLIDL